MSTKGLILAPRPDLTGVRFGRLVVCSLDSMRPGRGAYWVCLCDCGEPKVVQGAELKRSHISGKGTRSCGCLRDEQLKTHGQRYSREYISFRAAKSRCRDRKNRDYALYGGRGIQFKFATFEEWFAALGPRPEDATVDRIDSNGHYETGNVRWANADVQAQNQRRWAE